MRAIALGISLYISLGATCCKAQSAEETALFLARGMFEGRVWSESENTRFKITSDSPFSLTGDSKIFSRRYTATKSDKCVYVVKSFNSKNGGSFELDDTDTIDFSKATDVSFVSEQDTVKYVISNDPAFCVKDIRGYKTTCIFNYMRSQDTSQHRSRIISALQHMKANYCKGRAF